MSIKTSIYLSLFVGLICGLSCKNDDSTSKLSDLESEQSKYEGVKDLFEFLPSTETGVTFDNSIRDSLQMLIFSFEYLLNGGGVAVGDINNDGLQDLFFTGTLVPNKLYLNQGNWKFKDISASANINNNLGTNTGSSMIDINNDGLLDIYVCKSGTLNNPDARRNCLYINQGNLTFKEEAKQYNLDDPSFSTQAYFADYDLDGDLDVYFVNHPINWGNESALNLQVGINGEIEIIRDTNRLYITDRYMVNQNGKFIDKTYDSEVDNTAFGLSAVVYDYNGDNYPDIYICNDYSKPDRLMMNQKGKGFKDEIEKYFDNISASSMGSELLDINNDGEMDLFVNDMMYEDVKMVKQQQSYLNYDLVLTGRQYGYHDQFKYNSLQVKMEDGLYSNMSFLTETDKTGWSWGVLSADYDNNGYSDLFIANGYLKDVTNMDYSKFRLDSLRRISNGIPVGKLYKIWSTMIDSIKTKNYFYANEGQMKLTNVSKEWNSGPPSYSNGAAYADLDNDGDMDLIVNNINAEAFIMRNTLESKNKGKSLQVSLKSQTTTFCSNATLEYTDGTKNSQYYYPIKGFVSCVTPLLHFAIPQGKNAKEITVKWPKGNQEVFDVSDKSGIITLAEGNGSKITKTKTPSTPLFTKGQISYNHIENEYIDFKREPLLHMKHSVQGPCIGVADFNGDGIEDMVVGGAYQQSTSVFLQKNNAWSLLKNNDFEVSKQYEDVDIAIGDIDNDGDQDIVSLGGGYQWNQGSDQYGVRVYLNDGKANFRKIEVLGSRKINANAIALLDVDNDNDLDIIVGAGAIPGSYPFSAKSYILANNKNEFTSLEGVLPNEGDLGLIKDIAIGDIDKDGSNDIILAGEWREISVLAYRNGKYVNVSDKMGLDKDLGLWQTVELADIDNDGDMDILAGNLGLNSFFKASKTKPTCIYAADFDNNSENDPILCTYFGDKSYPVHSRDELLDQMTTLRKKYLRYASFADQDINDLFGKDKVSKATVFTATNFASTIFVNENGSFKAINMPLEAQLSMVEDIAIMDVDLDGINEIIIGGNYWDTDFDFGKYDASIGAILKRGKDGTFTSMYNTGYIANKNVRAVKVIGKNQIVVGNNNGPLEIFKLK